MTPDLSNARWVRSRACSSDGCVEVAYLESDGVAIRDSKNTHIAAHVFECQEWAAFIAGVKNREFDLPAS
jgi:hypothetical protein